MGKLQLQGLLKLSSYLYFDATINTMCLPWKAFPIVCSMLSHPLKLKSLDVVVCDWPSNF